jgi:hypothetical protein
MILAVSKLTTCTCCLGSKASSATTAAVLRCTTRQHGSAPACPQRVDQLMQHHKQGILSMFTSTSFELVQLPLAFNRLAKLSNVLKCCTSIGAQSGDSGVSCKQVHGVYTDDTTDPVSVVSRIAINRL